MDAVNAVGDSVKGFLKRPFREDGTALDWFLFLGLTIVISVLWGRIIKRLVD
jgi:hypothetical protein